MPSFTIPVQNLKENGPIFTVVLSPSEYAIERLTHDGKNVYSEEVVAMIDTGASHSVMADDLRFIRQLERTDIVEVNTPTSAGAQLARYNVMISLPSSTNIEQRLIAVPYLIGNVKCLIGRDILSRGSLDYDGRLETITLTF